MTPLYKDKIILKLGLVGLPVSPEVAPLTPDSSRSCRHQSGSPSLRNDRRGRYHSRIPSSSTPKAWAIGCQDLPRKRVRPRTEVSLPELGNNCLRRRPSASVYPVEPICQESDLFRLPDLVDSLHVNDSNQRLGWRTLIMAECNNADDRLVCGLVLMMLASYSNMRSFGSFHKLMT